MTSTHPWMRRRVRPATATTPGAATATTAAPMPPVPTPSAPTSTSPNAAAPSPVAPASTGGGLQLSFGSGSSAPAPTQGPGPARVPAAGSAPAGAAASNSTGPSPRVAARLAARQRRVRPFAAPDPRDVRVLDEDTAVVRVDRRRSAVGTLVVSGCTSTVWESTDHVVGAGTIDGGSAGRVVTTPGNRPLVGFDDGVALVALRHVRTLRRALFIARGAERLTVALHDGTAFAVDPGTSETMTILALSVVDGEVELRAEPFPRAPHDGEVFAAFGFTLSAPSIGA